MLSKSATLILGLVSEQPRNAYEIIKQLSYMKIRYWYDIADSTVYATIKSLEKKEYISGETEKSGNMPEKTIYTITESGKNALLETIRKNLLSFDYDTNVFSISSFFLALLPLAEQKELLKKRLTLLQKYLNGIEEQIKALETDKIPELQIENVKRLKEIICAEIKGTNGILHTIMM